MRRGAVFFHHFSATAHAIPVSAVRWGSRTVRQFFSGGILVTSFNRHDAGLTAQAVSKKNAVRPLYAGIAAALLLSCSPAALRADTSNAELAKEIAELKAQIRELRGSVTATRVETRREVQKVKGRREPHPRAAPAVDGLSRRRRPPPSSPPTRSWCLVA